MKTLRDAARMAIVLAAILFIIWFFFIRRH